MPASQEWGVHTILFQNGIHKHANCLWQERTINRFNGADYIAQRGAEAVYLEKSQKLIKENVRYYLDNSMYLRNAFLDLGFKVWGGLDCPFIWVKTKNDMYCWDFFNFMLEELNIVVIPGTIFGSRGDKYFRVSGLGLREDSEEAIRRINSNKISDLRR